MIEARPRVSDGRVLSQVRVIRIRAYESCGSHVSHFDSGRVGVTLRPQKLTWRCGDFWRDD
ncbi:hypothetical protein Hanom_Chr07g00656781 [Helianthus anomalus]